MKRRHRHRLPGDFLELGAVALMALLIGCASAPAAPPAVDESQLLAAGFKVVLAKTVQQQEHLQSLTPGRIAAWERNGTHYFVYPDVAKNELYVGTPKEYEAYRRLVPGGGPALAQQEAADLAAYNKQDAAMQRSTHRDLADPYYFWDSFEGLGW